jgi:hypothetical protein
MKRYYSDKAYRQRILDSVKKYRQTKKGKENDRKTRERFQRLNPTYIRDYLKNRRKIARNTGFCVRCFNLVAKKSIS